MRQLIDVQTVIKSPALISTRGAIAIPTCVDKAQESEEKKMERRWEEGRKGGSDKMDMGGIKDE